MNHSLIFAAALAAAALAGRAAQAAGPSSMLGEATTLSSATTGRTCKSNDVLDSITFSWCIERSTGADNSKILYFLHGANGNQYSLIDSAYYAQIKSLWKSAGVAEPVTISVTFGPKWLLTDLPSSYVARHPVLADFFVQRLMPYLESKVPAKVLGVARPKRRLLMGASMGSYNAALLVERRGDLFRNVVLGCPALFTSVHPFSSASEIDAYAARTAADPFIVQVGLEILGGDVQGRTWEDWERNNPLARVTSLNAASPAMLVWYNDSDAFGFAEGAREFASSAALLGVSIEEPMHNAGRHCQLDAAIVTRMSSFLR